MVLPSSLVCCNAQAPACQQPCAPVGPPVLLTAQDATGIKRRQPGMLEKMDKAMRQQVGKRGLSV